MAYLSKARYEKQLKRIKRNNASSKRKLALIRETEKYKKKKMETNKLIAIYLFCMLNIIVLYSMTAMWYFKDLSYLGVLITDIGAQILLYAIYCMKAYHGKKQEEDLKFRREQFNGTLSNILQSGVESDAQFDGLEDEAVDSMDN